MARDFSMLHPKVQELANKLKDLCAKQGLIIKVTDCVRTEEEQAALYAQGRTAPGAIVTNAKYPKSMHCWGMAFDICRNDGKGAYEDKDGFFTKVGRIGQSIGLAWGGECFGKSLIDKPHFHLLTYGDYPELTTCYTAPSNFMQCWRLDKPLQTITKTSRKDDIKWLQQQLNQVISKKLINNAKLVVDGSYGEKTKSAYLNYARYKGWMLPDGWTVGANGINALERQ